jgi:hypothetical protein
MDALRARIQLQRTTIPRRRIEAYKFPGWMAIHTDRLRLIEAKSTARLHHTNIVPVFGVGEQDAALLRQFIQGLGMDEVLDELIRQQSKGAVTPQRQPSRELDAAALAHSLLSARIA